MVAHEWKIPSDLIHMKPAVADALYFLCKNLPQIESRCLWEFKLILSELIVNGIIHGNHSDSAKFISIKLVIAGDAHDPSVSCEIADEGDGFDYQSFNSNPENNESPGGRGIIIVNGLSDTIKFNETGNKISFLKRVVIDG